MIALSRCAYRGIAVFLLLMLFNGANVYAAESKKAKIAFSNMRHHFGKIYRGERRTHKFEFTNRGKSPLFVRAVHSSCGCANVRVEPKMSFAPGEKGYISFEFDSSQFEGKVVRTLVVDSNASERMTRTLTFTANVLPELSLTPASVDFGDISGTKLNKQTVRSHAFKIAKTNGKTVSWPSSKSQGEAQKELSSEELKSLDGKSGGATKIVRVTSSHPKLTASVVMNKKSDLNKGRIIIKLESGLPVGPFNEYVTVWNNSVFLKGLKIPVHAHVTGRAKLSTSFVEFGVVTPKKSANREIRVRVNSKKKMAKEDVEIQIVADENMKELVSKKFLSIETRSLKDGVGLQFELKFPERMKLPMSRVAAKGHFLITLNTPEKGQYKVPFFGVLRQDLK